MKTTIRLIAFTLILFLNSCKKEEDSTPALQCKLTVIDRGNGNKHIYAYDAAGKITTMTREFDPDGSGKISKYVYTLTYDIAGLLKSSAATLNGQPDIVENYTYTNGKISKTTFEYSDGSKGVNSLKYDAAGRLTEFTFETGDVANYGKQFFEYNSDGIMIRRGYAGLDGTLYFEAKTKPVGITKSPEILLTNNGLPFDLLTGFGYSTTEGGVGTISEVYFADENGQMVAGGTSKITAIKTNAKGYVTEISSEDDTKAINTSKFELLDCN